MKHPIGSIAHRLTRKYGTHDPFVIAASLGIKTYVTDLGGLKGFCCIIMGVCCIFINENLSQEMQKMVCAHELGHCLLHEDNLKSGGQYTEYNITANLNRAEYEANTFSAFLLIDDSEMLEYLYNGLDFYDTAKALYIDVNFLAIRLMECPPPEIRVDVPFAMKSSFLKYIDDSQE